jgi:hypothetical protein
MSHRIILNCTKINAWLIFSACVGTFQCIMFMKSFSMEFAYYTVVVTDFTYVLGTESWCRDSFLNFFSSATFFLSYSFSIGGI